MASRVGLAIRNEKAQGRLNDALSQLAGRLGADVPEQPARSRDVFLSETLRLEWTADTIEALASAAPEKAAKASKSPVRKAD